MNAPITIETQTQRTVIINGKWIFRLPVETKTVAKS
jgi:hypothetical protein